MSEQDIRGGLRDAVADEPPLDFDPNALVAAARHQVRRRRALVAAGVATAAVAVAGVAVPVALGRPAPHVVADRPSASATTTSPAPTTTSSAQIQWPPSDVQAVPYTPDQLRTRGQEMRAHLRATVPGLLSQASAFEFGQFGGEAAGDFYDGQNYVTAELSYVVAGARYSVFVQIWAPGSTDGLLDSACGTDCQQIGEQDGAPVMARTDQNGSGTTSLVYHFRKNGCVVQIAAYSYDMSGAGPDMPTIPVTVEQQATLATDPDLGL